MTEADARAETPQQRLRAWAEDMEPSDWGSALLHVGMVGSAASVGYVWGYTEAAAAVGGLALAGVGLSPQTGVNWLLVTMALIVVGLSVEQLAPGGESDE
jgi:hypothetical protein